MVKFFKQHLKLLAAMALPVMAFIFLVVKIIIPATGHMTHGFAAYYTASILLARGDLGPQAYDNAWFSQQVHAAINLPIDEIMTPSLPTQSLIVLPLVFLSPQPARAVWLWFNLVVLLIALAILINISGAFSQDKIQPMGLIFSAFALIFPAVAANFYVGQSIILFFGLFVLALWGLVSRRHWLAGLALGLAFILKTTGLSLWLLLLVHRRWKALLWGGGTIMTIVLLSLPWIGPATWWAYLQAVRTVMGSSIMTVTAYQTTAGFFAHLFQFDPLWNPYPIYHWPILARTLTLAVAITALSITLWLGRDRSSLPHFFAALVPLSVILLPVAEEHHFVVLLIPIFILIDDLLKYPISRDSGWLDRFLVSIALLLLIIPVPYDDLALSVGWLALLAYPRLYGAWLLWVVAIRRLSLSRSGRDRSIKTGRPSTL